MSFISRIKAKILSRPFSRNINSLRYEPLDLIYKLEDLNAGYYDKIKHLGDAELEHQIGRLTNFKKIIGEISSQILMVKLWNSVLGKVFRYYGLHIYSNG